MTYTVIDKFYGGHPATTVNRRAWQRLLDAVLPLFEPGAGGSFIDLGCHNGDKTLALAEFIGAELVVGVDFAGPALRLARGKGIETLAVDLNQDAALPFPEASFDCIHTGEVIEHLFSPDLLLAEVARLLKPGGYAVITTPNLASWRNRLALLGGWQPFGTEVSTQFRVGNPRSPQGILAGHIRMFTPRALRELVERHGLKVDQLSGWTQGSPTDLLTQVLSTVDGVAEMWFPALCDGILLKCRC